MRNSITNTIAITLGKLHNTKLLVFRTRSSCFSSRLAAEMFWGSETRVIIKISTHSWYLRTFDWFSWKWSKKNQYGWLKKPSFSKLMWLYLYGHEAVRHKLKNMQKMHLFVFLGHFWAYVWQPHDHIGWATSMPFASINSTNPRTNPWNFHKKYWELAILKNSVFLSRPFWFFFSEKKYFFASSPWKSVTNYVLERMGLV